MDNLTVSSQRLVHIDLKGAPPKPSYFEKLFPFIKSYGATGILLEWEDTFPYSKELLQIGGLSNSAQATGAPYSIEDAKQILEFAADCDLLVIPLVQTFGHMEFVLKHDQWRNLREVGHYPSSMCPSNSESMALVRNMVKQIIAFHQNLQYIHIGADEIWHLGMCPTCLKRSQISKHGKASLYLDHVTSVSQFIKENYPNLKIIIWDDMMRSMELKILQDYDIGNLVEPMVWHYNSLQNFELAGSLWEKYSDVFKYIWLASAFKGSTSSCQIIPILKHHISNHEAWLRQLDMHGNKILNLRGIAFTGWSRYDHYATLCEMMPCAIPSLCHCLKTWLSGSFTQDIQLSICENLGFPDGYFSENCVKMPSLQLNFPGGEIFLGMEWYCILRTKFKGIVNSDQMQTWFNQWQIYNNYTNPMQIDTILPFINELLVEISTNENYLKTPLENTFYPHTIEELQGTLFTPMKQQLLQIKSDCETQLALGCRVRGQKRMIT
ncbi:hypothetical protein WA026_000086 [Henosepilachna vigintioctopunctata]|uniref:beta-N-acetylhexosaminidase n=1 Tax=Henosepilachna vigintioctopunctata TaxID=420089 RepID=A0AAW1UWC6_9CUCU